MRAPRVLAIALLLGCGCGRAGAPGRRAAASPVSAPAPPDTASRAALPALRRVDAVALRDIVRDGRAPVTLVNVWASWCVPCREEFPELLAAARAHASQGVRLVLVSADFDEQLGDARAFLAAQGVREGSYLKTGSDQAFIDSLDERWSGALPATFVYDRRGRRIAFWEGRADRARFEAAIRSALKASTRP